MIAKLIRRHSDDSQIVDELRAQSDSVKAAALLHDIGHGPFSHVFERVFEAADTRPPSHEAWSCEILRNAKSQVADVLRTKQTVDVDLVCSLISSEEEAPDCPHLKDIVSSQLDADRLDYLLRDGMMTGSRHGTFDSEWLLNVLEFGEVGLESPSDKKLCINAKGVGAIEGFLLARLLMYQFVYGHKTTRAYEAEFIQTLRLAVKLTDFLPATTPEPVLRVLASPEDCSTDDYLMLDDEVMWWALRCWAVWDGVASVPQESRALAEALTRHAMRLVRRDRPWKTVNLKGAMPITRAKRLVTTLQRRCDPLAYECYVDDLTKSPYKPWGSAKREGSSDPEALRGEICVVSRGGDVGPLSETPDSHIIKSLMDEQSLCRFHYDRHFHDEFSGPLSSFGVC